MLNWINNILYIGKYLTIKSAESRGGPYNTGKWPYTENVNDIVNGTLRYTDGSGVTCWGPNPNDPTELGWQFLPAASATDEFFKRVSFRNKNV